MTLLTDAHMDSPRPQTDGAFICQVLQFDPELGAAIAISDRAQAERAARGRLFEMPVGACRLDDYAHPSAHIIGMLVVEGLICREVRLRDRHLIDLLGPGDLLQPDGNEEFSDLVLDEGCTVLEHARVIALGTTFIRAAGRWPDLMTSALGRMRRQHMRLTTQSLIVLLPRAEHRLLLMVAHLSDRWGRVTPDGIHLPLRLTHDVLGQLIGSRRPTVTIALNELGRQGHLVQREDTSWVITEAGQRAIRQISKTDPNATSLGKLLATRQQAGELLLDARALRASAHLAAGAPPATRPFEGF
jgi:CRP-like cAMP-binding protein